jgi:hypothetical protein
MPPQYSTGTEDRSSVMAGSSDTVGTGVDLARAWLDPIRSLIEQYPWPTVLLAFGIGYAISRRMR